MMPHYILGQRDAAAVDRVFLYIRVFALQLLDLWHLGLLETDEYLINDLATWTKIPQAEGNLLEVRAVRSLVSNDSENGNGINISARNYQELLSYVKNTASRTSETILSVMH